jgi:hypothetical protein
MANCWKALQPTVSSKYPVKLFGIIVFGCAAVAVTLASFLTVIGWMFLAPLVLMVWILFLVALVHALRPR